MAQFFVVLCDPMGKPRMTQQDKWKKRPAVMRYRAYADRLRMHCPNVMKEASTVSWTAFIAMPPSWSEKKKLAMEGTPHRAKPDRDNIDKGILDALFKESDAGIASGTLSKFWDDGFGARLEITIS